MQTFWLACQRASRILVEFGFWHSSLRGMPAIGLQKVSSDDFSKVTGCAWQVEECLSQLRPLEHTLCEVNEVRCPLAQALPSVLTSGWQAYKEADQGAEQGGD